MSDKAKQKTRGLMLGTFIWVVGVSTGGVLVVKHEFTPGPSASAATWPADVSLTRTKDRPTLLMFVHPRCPCSSASMEELARVVTLCRERVSASVVFFTPTESPEQWLNQSSWKQANSLPGVSTIRDDGGAIARSFGVITSGQVLLFDQQGALVFSGGITGSRGHAGDNAGVQAVVQLIRGTIDTPAHPLNTPVFGCAIAAPEDKP